MPLKKLSLLVSLLMVLATVMEPAAAGAVHVNQVALRQESRTLLQFEFQINPTAWLHQLLAPASDVQAFIKSQAALPEAQFRQALEKAQRRLETENFLMLPSGAKVALRNWQMPQAALLQEMLRRNVLILDLPPQFQGHLEPITITASAKASVPLGRVQLTLSPVFYPVQLRHQQDAVWFTPLLPTSLIDLP